MTILIKFLVSYTPEGSTNPERDLTKISKRYLKNGFVMEFITVIPFTSLSLGGYERLFYLIKVLRLFIGFKVFNVHLIMQRIKKITQDRTKDLI